jgi:ubiquinone/menaquinone biosynthesis C-methylase UbiE
LSERNRESMAHHHVCPWWMGYLLATPLRRLFEKPEKLLEPFLHEGMTAVDYGCGMGYFTLPMARMVGPHGKIIAVDLQEKMLGEMQKRAGRAGLAERIEPVLAGSDGAAIQGQVDFVAALYVVHELPDAKAFFAQMRAIMKPGAKLFMIEPGSRVTEAEFAEEIDIATSTGLELVEEGAFGRGRGALLVSP